MKIQRKKKKKERGKKIEKGKSAKLEKGKSAGECRSAGVKLEKKNIKVWRGQRRAKR
jgi:hypothetical protein